MTTTTANIEAEIGATVWSVDDKNQRRSVVADLFDAYDLADGEFLIRAWTGYVTIGRFTGRTRKFFRIDCPTIERYEIETYATDSTHRHGEGVVMGRKADRISGTYAIRPELTSRKVRA